MEKLFLLFTAVLVVFAISACTPMATPDDCSKVCAKKSALDTAANPPKMEDPAAKVEAEFAGKMTELQKEIDKVAAPIEKERGEKLAKAKKDPDKAKINQEYDAKKAAKVKEFQPKIDELKKAKEAALKTAQEAKVKMEADMKAAKEKATKACADKCVADKTSKPKADCQAAASNLDSFNKCQ